MAGLPAYVPFIFMSLVTTLPAPITVPEQIFTGKIVELDPITLSSIVVGKKFLNHLKFFRL